MGFAWGYQVTDAGLECLKGFEALEEISLGPEQVSFAALAQSTRLTRIIDTSKAITDADLESLSETAQVACPFRRFTDRRRNGFFSASSPLLSSHPERHSAYRRRPNAAPVTYQSSLTVAERNQGFAPGTRRG